MVSDLGSVALETFATAGSTHLHGTETDNTGVDAASNTVLLLNIDLGQVEVLRVKSELLFDVSLGGAVDEVAHLESLNGLVLGAALGAVEATNVIGVALVALISSVVSSFDWHNLIIILNQ